MLFESHSCLYQAYTSGKRLRNIYLFSDCHISNEDYVVRLCQRHLWHSRLFVFACGGKNANKHAARRLAAAGGGYCEFITPSALPNKVKMMRQMKRGLQVRLGCVSPSPLLLSFTPTIIFRLCVIPSSCPYSHYHLSSLRCSFLASCSHYHIRNIFSSSN